MFAIISNGAIALLVQAGTPFEWDGIQYPANWCNLSTPKEKAAIGMVDVVYAQMPNEQFYWATQNAPVYNAATNQVDVTYTATPKDLFTLQSNAVNQANQAAWTILSPTDWMVVRSVESGGVYPVPQAWNTWRQAIRKQAADYVTAISACTTVDQLAALPPVQWAHDPNWVAPSEA
jgi:hypothetical protein